MSGHPAAAADRRRARRAAAWRHHPDRGGSATDFIATLAAFDDPAKAPTGLFEPVIVVGGGHCARLARRLHRWRRRRWRRRYINL